MNDERNRINALGGRGMYDASRARVWDVRMEGGGRMPEEGLGMDVGSKEWNDSGDA